jgi:hypothetical protein
VSTESAESRLFSVPGEVSGSQGVQHSSQAGGCPGWRPQRQRSRLSGMPALTTSINASFDANAQALPSGPSCCPKLGRLQRRPVSAAHILLCMCLWQLHHISTIAAAAKLRVEASLRAAPHAD